MPKIQEDFEIYNEDCFETFKRIPSESVDIVLCDPPYGTTRCKWDSIIPLDKMWTGLLRVCKPTATFIFTASQPFTSVLVCSQIELFRHEWIWIKNRGSNFANTVREPMKEHESIIVFSRGRWTYNKQMQSRTGGGLGLVGKPNPTGRKQREGIGRFKEFTDRENLSELRVPSSWQKFNTACGTEKSNHPTQKPVELMEYLVKTYTNEGDTVLDFAMGSGTTGVACGSLNRRFIGCDNDTEHGYFEIAKRRIEAAYAKN